MMRSLCAVPFLVGAALTAPAQDLPGVRTLLVPEVPFVGPGKDVVLRFVIDAEAAATLPGDWLTALTLDVKVDDAPGPQVREPGKGGSVPVAAGTHIERTLKLPLSKLLPNGEKVSS